MSAEETVRAYYGALRAGEAEAVAWFGDDVRLAWTDDGTRHAVDSR